MTSSLIAACIWALAATVTALLPMRVQYRLGLALLLTAPALLICLYVENGPWVVTLCLLAILSLFRKPLAYLIRKTLSKTGPKP